MAYDNNHGLQKQDIKGHTSFRLVYKVLGCYYTSVACENSAVYNTTLKEPKEKSLELI